MSVYSKNSLMLPTLLSSSGPSESQMLPPEVLFTVTDRKIHHMHKETARYPKPSSDSSLRTLRSFAGVTSFHSFIARDCP